MQRLAVLLVLALTLGACGTDLARTSQGAEILARCGGDEPPEPGTVDGPTEVELTVSIGDGVSPGDTFGFDWNVPGQFEVVTGDEWLVECWTGGEWIDAWFMVDVYNNHNGPEALLLDDGIGGTDDGYGPTPGTIIIPDSAPTGWYRLNERVSIGDASGSELVEREARFEVTS